MISFSSPVGHKDLVPISWGPREGDRHTPLLAWRLECCHLHHQELDLSLMTSSREPVDLVSEGVRRGLGTPGGSCQCWPFVIVFIKLGPGLLYLAVERGRRHRDSRATFFPPDLDQCPASQVPRASSEHTLTGALTFLAQLCQPMKIA